MSAAIAYLGSNIGIVTAVTLSPTSVIGIAHSLPTVPDIWAIKRLYSGANTSLTHGIDINADSTTLTFTNKSSGTVGCDAWFQCLHSITR